MLAGVYGHHPGSVGLQVCKTALFLMQPGLQNADEELNLKRTLGRRQVSKSKESNKFLLVRLHLLLRVGVAIFTVRIHGNILWSPDLATTKSDFSVHLL